MWKQSNGNVLCVIDPAALGADPMLFGLAIVDAVRHGATAYAQAVNVDEKHAFERIMEGVNADLANPTETPRPLRPEGQSSETRRVGKGGRSQLNVRGCTD